MGTSLFPDPLRGPQQPPAPNQLLPPAAPLGAPQPTTLFPSGTPDDSDRLRQSLRIGQTKPPSNASRVLSLSQKTGLPSAVVERNTDAIATQQQTRDLDADQFRLEHPTIAKYMAEHPLHSSVAVPDLQQLGFIEAAATAIRMGWRGGLAQSKVAEAQHRRMTSGESDPMGDFLLEQRSKESQRAPSNRSFLQDVLYETGKLGGQMAPGLPEAGVGAELGFIGGAGAIAAAAAAGVTLPFTLPAAITAGALAGTATYVFRQESGSSYEELGQVRDRNGQPLSPEMRRNAAVGVGAINAAIEVAVDATVLAKPFVAAARKFTRNATGDLLVRPTMRRAMTEFGKAYAGALIAEPTQEVAQEMTNVIAEEFAKTASHGDFETIMNSADQREQVILRLTDIAKQTAKGTLLLAGVGPSLNLGTDIVRAKRATAIGEHYKALGEHLQTVAAPTKEAGAHTAIATDAMGAETTFYIDVDKFTEYFQSHNVDPREAARQIWGDDAQVYDQASQAGHALEIPARTYAEKIAPTKVNDFFARELRVADPDAMNAREGEALLKDPEGEHQKRLAEAAEATKADAVRETLVENVAQRLSATGQYRDVDARTMAEPMADFFRVMGERTGQDPLTLFERYGPTIQQETAERAAAAALEQGARPAAPLTPETLTAFREGVTQRLGLKTFDVYARPSTGDLDLTMLEVPAGQRQQGVGTAAMRELVAFADRHGKRLVLSPNVRDAARGTTSRARLVKFYKEFGFVENKGHNKDFSISGAMYRAPQAPEPGPREFFQSLSTRVPTAKKATEDVMAEPRLVVGLASSKADPVTFAKNTAAIAKYPNMQVVEETETPDEIAERFIEHVVENLLWLHDNVPEDIRARSKLWYVGARALADRWSAKYGRTDIQVAGILAVLSPQKDWFMNVGLAQRVLDIMTDQQNTPWSDEMTSTAARIYEKPEYAERLASITGKTLGELPTPELKAMWLRAYDEAHNARTYRLVTPEGEFGGPVLKEDGEAAKIAWGSLGSIEKAISIYEDGSAKNVSDALGGEHKVRSFYNNIWDPFAPEGDVTIDTHAVAAGLLRALSGNTLEVTQNFGGAGSASTSVFGANGTYGIHAEAYHRAARARNLLPREMQSITWEAVRGLFPAKFKAQKANVEAVDAIWKRYRSGEFTIEQARALVLERAGGFRPPEWWSGGAHGVEPGGLPRGAGRDTGGDEGARGADHGGAVSGAGVPRGGTGPAAGRGVGGAPAGDQGPAPAGERTAERVGEREFQQPAFHGSPHIFDQFSLHAIGTGEGAQVYRWGLYFAGKKEVAQFYRDTLSSGNRYATLKIGPWYAIKDGTVQSIRFGDEGVESVFWSLADDLIEEAQVSGPMNTRQMASFVDDWFTNFIRREQGLQPELADAARELRDVEVKKPGGLEATVKARGGRLYTVDIPGDDTMVWQEHKLSEQPPAVRAALIKAMAEIGLPLDKNGVPTYVQSDPDGEAIYAALASSRGEEGASRMLGELGVNGIRYRDSSSRYTDDWVVTNQNAAGKTINSFRFSSEAEAQAYLAGKEYAKQKAQHGYVDNTVQHRRPDRTYNYVIFDDKLVKIMEFEQAQQGAQDPRGRILFGDNGRAVIELFKSADLSTFLHESGHLYLEAMHQMAQDAAPDSPIVEDIGVIRSWLGANEGKSLTREQHEKFARANEAYLLEGKAPSQELRRAFARFRTWLLALYRSVQGLDVELSPEIRGVFDRMFATDREIDSAQNEAGLVPIFADAESMGVSERAFEAYRKTAEDAHIAANDRLRTRILRQKMRERDAWWKEAREEMRAEVAAEVEQRPAYVALSALRKGALPDGTKIRRLNKEEINKLRGEEFLRRANRLGLYAAKNGIPLEEAAEEFGFASGDELLTALTEAPPRNEVIDAITDRRMTEKYGDMVSDGTLAEEAEAAVMNTQQAAVIRAEMRALRALERHVKPFVEAERKERQAEEREGRATFAAGVPDPAWISDLARQRIGSLRIRDLKPAVYWTAARKASRAAVEAMGKKDYTGALNAKQSELLNLELYRQTTAVKDETEAKQQYIRSLQEPKKQQQLAKAGGDYRDQINALLERYDFKTITDTAADRRASLAAFVKRQEELGLPVNIPPEMLERTFTKPWREMTVEELRGVVDTIKHIDHLASLKNRLLKSESGRTLEESRDLAAATITENAKKTIPRQVETNLPQDRAARAIGAFVAAHRKLASLLRQMEGFVDGGPLTSMIMRPLNAASDAESEFNADATQRLKAIWDRHYTKDERVAMYRPDHQPTLKNSPLAKDGLTKMGRLMMALNWGTEDNQRKLVDGLSIGLGETIDESHVGGVLNTLDERDWKFVSDVWEMIGSYWPQIAGLAERLDGIPPTKIDGVEIATKFGPVQGEYFPIKYDRSQSRIKAHDQIAVTADEVRRGSTVKASTKAGARHERVAGVRSPLRLDFGVIREHLVDLSLDLTHTETLIDVGRILTGDEVKAAVRDHYGDVVYRQMMSAVDAIAAGNAPPLNAFDSALNFMRTGATVAGLGWNLVTSALQPIGLTNSVVRVGPKWIAQGLGEWIGDALHMENTARWITEKSTMMKYRTTTQMRETGELMNTIGFNRGLVAAMTDRGISKATMGAMDLADLSQSYFWFITRMQLVADIPTWLGAYRKALASMPIGELDEAEAIAQADQAVLDSQSGGAIKDLAGVQRGNAALKMWTNFYSYMNLAFNQHAEALGRMDVKKPASVGRAAVDLLMLSVVPVTLGYFVRRALRGTKDDDDPADILRDLAREEGSFLTGMMLGVRELSGAVQGYAGYEGPAGARGIASATKLVKQVSQGEADHALWTALNGTAGVLLHYPAAQVQRTADGIMALRRGETRNPLAVLVGPPR